MNTLNIYSLTTLVPRLGKGTLRLKPIHSWSGTVIHQGCFKTLIDGTYTNVDILLTLITGDKTTFTYCYCHALEMCVTEDE